MYYCVLAPSYPVCGINSILLCHLFVINNALMIGSGETKKNNNIETLYSTKTETTY